jgi:formylglycine-generating enzyme required for sulfatase activity
MYPGWKDTVEFDDGYAFTAPVGSFRSNAFGLYDMIGNVSQWCQDGPRKYTKESVENPFGPVNDDQHALRGGPWCVERRYYRAATRGVGFPPGVTPNESLGFRVLALPLARTP